MFDRKRFWRLVEQDRDRGLNEDELQELDNLRERRPELAALEDLDRTWLAVLRTQSMEPTISDRFDQNLKRRYDLESRKDRVRYWSPAVIGAAIAAGVLFAIFQVISSPPAAIDLKNHEAMNAGTPVEFPSFTP